MKTHPRRQHPVKNGRGIWIRRIPRASCILPVIESRIEHTARKFGVSPSFVVAVALAEFFGIEEQERYTST
jgi:hypothetical protein